jgi:hypothetical protein
VQLVEHGRSGVGAIRMGLRKHAYRVAAGRLVVGA